MLFFLAQKSTLSDISVTTPAFTSVCMVYPFFNLSHLTCVYHLFKLHFFQAAYSQF